MDESCKRSPSVYRRKRNWSTPSAIENGATAVENFVDQAASAIGTQQKAEVAAQVAYDNAVATAGQQFVNTMAPAAAALYEAGYTSDAWTQYQATLKSATAAEQAADHQANVTRVQSIGTAEVALAGSVGQANVALAQSQGSVETSLTGQLAGVANTLAGQQTTADENFTASLGSALGALLKSTASAEQQWTTQTGSADATFRRWAATK